MSKASRPCPICEEVYIVTIIDSGRQIAFPSCFKCGYGANEKENKDLVIINLKDLPHLANNNTEVLKESLRVWETFLDICYEKKKDSNTPEEEK